jgi:hypothetical protein
VARSEEKGGSVAIRSSVWPQGFAPRVAQEEVWRDTRSEKGGASGCRAATCRVWARNESTARATRRAHHSYESSAAVTAATIRNSHTEITTPIRPLHTCFVELSSAHSGDANTGARLHVYSEQRCVPEAHSR